MAKKKKEQPKAKPPVSISDVEVFAALESVKQDKSKAEDALKLYDEYAKIVKTSGAQVNAGLKALAVEVRNQ